MSSCLQVCGVPHGWGPACCWRRALQEHKKRQFAGGLTLGRIGKITDWCSCHAADPDRTRQPAPELVRHPRGGRTRRYPVLGSSTYVRDAASRSWDAAARGPRDRRPLGHRGHDDDPRATADLPLSGLRTTVQDRPGKWFFLCRPRRYPAIDSPLLTWMRPKLRGCPVAAPGGRRSRHPQHRCGNRLPARSRNRRLDVW